MTETAARESAAAINLARHPDSLGRMAWRRLRRDRIAQAGMTIVAVAIVWIVAVTVARAVVEPANDEDERTALWRLALSIEPARQYVGDEKRPPVFFYEPPPKADDGEAGAGVSFAERFKAGMEHPLGTDKLGRDVLAVVVEGGRSAILYGSLIAAIGTGLGFLLGAVAGYFGRLADELITWLLQVVASIPGLLMVIAVAYAIKTLESKTGGDYSLLIFAIIGLITWVGTCRVVRGEFLRLRENDYVTAARALGASWPRIVLAHLGRNASHLAIIFFSLGLVRAINYIVILNFLNIGEAGMPTWGGVIGMARQSLFGADRIWWPIVSVTLAMFLVVWAVNVMGDRLRDALDPGLRSES